MIPENTLRPRPELVSILTAGRTGLNYYHSNIESKLD